MADINTQVHALFLELDKETTNAQFVLKQIVMRVDRGGPAGLVAYLKNVIKKSYKEEVQDLVDASTIVLISRHKMEVAKASLKLKKEEQVLLKDYIAKIKKVVKAK